MRGIQISIHSDRRAVTEFIKALREVLYDENFDIDKNLVVIRKSKSQEKEQYNTHIADLSHGIRSLHETNQCCGSLSQKQLLKKLPDV